MQVKPRFESFKIIERHPILTDDTGNEMCLTLLECKLPSSPTEVMLTPYRFYAVIGKNQQVWNNKAISYDTQAYWKNGTRRTLIKVVIGNIEIEEVIYGSHYIFSRTMSPMPEDSGISTTFKMKLISA